MQVEFANYKLNVMKKYYFVFILMFVSLLGFAQNVRYSTANLNLRQLPSTNSKVITVIPEGTPVTIDDDCECDWIPVSYCGQIGYVSGKYLKKEKTSVSNENTNRSVGTIKYYINSRGVRVQSPTYYNKQPAGATALCRDGTYSFSQNRRGTCSGHGGVARWL